MQEFFTSFFQGLGFLITKIQVYDIIEMLVLSFLFYKGIKLVHETRAEQLLKGILFLFGAFILINQFGDKFRVMNFILENFFQVGIIAVIIMFQPEFRRVLEKMGRTKVSNIAINFEGSNEIGGAEGAIKEIAEACFRLSHTATGALIVIERQTRLGEQIDTGTIVRAVPSAELLCNIFYPNTPLHDGAVIIRDGLVYAAGCFLPKPQKEELISKDLGSRHRAAIGMSEVSDAVVIAVSEETGMVSVAENGTLTRGFTKESLIRLLTARLIPEPTEKIRKKPKLPAKPRKD